MAHVFEILTTVIALLGVAIAAIQLRRAADALERSAEANQISAQANNIANLMAVLQLEESINQAGYQLADASRKHTAEGTPETAGFVDVCIERYLNAIDRFCQCLRSGIVDEDMYRRDYRQRIANAVEKNEKFFRTTTPYLHIKHVYQSWKADRSAVDQVKRLQGVAPNKLALPRGD